MQERSRVGPAALRRAGQPRMGNNAREQTLQVNRKVNAMREKLQPWMSAIFCACLSLIAIVSFIGMLLMNNGDTRVAVTVALIPFLSFLPMCFFHVGTSLSQMRQENRDLRAQLQDLMSKVGVVK